MRDFRLFTAGQGISVAGNWMQNVAVGWLVLELTGSGGALGVILAARYAPLLLFGPWGGLIADRHDRRLLIRITSVTQAAIACTLGALTVTHVINAWSLGLLILAAGFVDVVDTPSRQTLINDLVGRDRLGNAIALNSIIVNAARIAGPGAAGFLIASLGVGPCFFANAASFGAMVLGVQLMHARDARKAAVLSRAEGQIRGALREVARTPDLCLPLLMVTVTGAFAWEFQVTLPLFSASTFHGDATTYGGALASLAAGAICGGFMAARRRRVTTTSLARSALGWGVVICAASAAPNLIVAYPLLAVVGACAVAFNSAAKTVLQLVAPPTMRGRVMALWSIGWQGSTVIGAPAVGFIGAWLGARYALGFGGVAALAVGTVALALRRGQPVPSESDSRPAMRG